MLSVKSVGKRKAAKTICGISEICVEFGLEAKTPPKIWLFHIKTLYLQAIVKKIKIMGKIIDKTITKIVTEEGISLFRRVTKVLMPNGKYRYPVDYFDATPGVVKVSKEEMDKVAIPVYKKLI